VNFILAAAEVVGVGGPAGEFPANILSLQKYQKNTYFAQTTNNIIPFTRESVFFSTPRHYARRGGCRSIGKIGLIFAPAVFVSDKNAYGP